MADADPSLAPAAESEASGSNTTRHEDEETRSREIQQAKDEGHDADIPSGIGYILDEEGEKKRRQSIADQRRSSVNERHSRAEQRDIEKEAGASPVDVPAGEPAARGEGTSSEDEANIVWWDGPDDPANPYNWPGWVKVVNCVFISVLTLITPLGSSIFAPGVPELMKDFGSDSPELAAFVVSVYVLGFAVGPLIIAPLSEIYGRLMVYHLCNVGFIAFLVACALAPSLNSLIAFRFLSGVFGSCPLTNGGGSIADMIVQEKRGAAMAAFSIGPLFGPVVGPVAGGFLAAAEGWRWVFWLSMSIARASHPLTS
jgi:multidrug resistance protein